MTMTPPRRPSVLLVLSAALPLLAPFVAAGWIDEDTPSRLRTTSSLVDGSTYHLVMSDEFNVPGRTFKDGDDPTWTALDKVDPAYSSSGGGALHFYNSSTVSTTPDGMLTIRSIIADTTWQRYDPVQKKYESTTKHFRSGHIQSWNKFCFTGGIVEVDLVLPGEPDIGGLWPAAWMFGNLGRATYMTSTNQLWPWSYDVCDREKQEGQAISACNEVNHYGLNKNQGRGATEIDIIELMAGVSQGKGGFEAATEPPVAMPFVDMTLQIAPGITEQRPQSGHQPIRTIDVTRSGFATSVAENWYDNLTVAGNTSLNPFFYGTYLAETKPGEPVTRSKKQAFQADAVGAMHQIVPEHFKTPHTFRVEWQPGRGGRLDWFTKSYKRVDENGTVFHMEGDGKGKDWEHSLYIPDFALDNAMGSKIPEEPSYLIFNTAISSTWGFPYSLPDWCPKDCYDCTNPKCTCSFQPGFCNMMKTGKVAFKIDAVRVYQSRDDSAHVGRPHTVGCDPLEFPTREFIKGYEYKYMNTPPFVFGDKHPLRKVKNGGGICTTDEQCGGGGVEDAEVDESWVLPGVDANDVLDLDVEGKQPNGITNEQKRRLDGRGQHLDKPPISEEAVGDGGSGAKVLSKKPHRKPKGQCVKSTPGLFGLPTATGKQCKCKNGYTGPHCLSGDKHDDSLGAYELTTVTSLFANRARPYLTPLHVFILGTFVGGFLLALVMDTVKRGRKNRATGREALKGGFKP